MQEYEKLDSELKKLDAKLEEKEKEQHEYAKIMTICIPNQHFMLSYSVFCHFSLTQGSVSVHEGSSNP